MAKMDKQKRIAKLLLDRYGMTYAEELGIDLGKETPGQLFKWLCASILYSARISEDLATQAAKALKKEGLTTAEKMADANWGRRTKILNQSGYARYDESTSTMLGETAEMVLDDFGGDLRNLRKLADRNPDEERKLLKQFKGIGDTGVDIFFREIQLQWQELYPFMGKRELQAAQQLGLGKSAEEIAKLVSRKDFPRLAAALVRSSKKGRSEVLDAA